MKAILDLIGREWSLEQVSKTMAEAAKDSQMSVIGAMHMICADESEFEVCEAFQKHFVHSMLPELKDARAAAFTLSNLGARYDPGAVHVAEHHYALGESTETPKLMVIKVNGHVGIKMVDGLESFGTLGRYGLDSACCGALHAMMGGAQGPFVTELKGAFNKDGIDRLALLDDPAQVPPTSRSLFVAVSSAILQAEAVADDILSKAPASPTLSWVVPCVTCNRPGEDTEIVCGLIQVDYRKATAERRQMGLGNTPSKYRLDRVDKAMRIREENGA